MDKNLNLTKEWDKVFPQSDKVSHSKVTFRNRYGITLAADMYKPKHADGKLPAIAISGPFGAVKEQSSGLYAQELAERGFLTIAFDPSYTGESGGEPRYVASPDINTEDFCAAVDFLSTRDDVDAEHIGILGICGWGGLSLIHILDIHQAFERNKRVPSLSVTNLWAAIACRYAIAHSSAYFFPPTALVSLIKEESKEPQRRIRSS